MEQPTKRIRLKSLSDVQREHARVYKEARSNKITMGDLTSLSQALNRMHSMLVSDKELDISEEMNAISQQLADIEARR